MHPSLGMLLVSNLVTIIINLDPVFLTHGIDFTDLEL